jgi:hypothetical protein
MLMPDEQLLRRTAVNPTAMRARVKRLMGFSGY